MSNNVNGWALNVYQGLAGDHNDLALPGALRLAQTFSDALGQPMQTVGQPAPALNSDWSVELPAALTDLRALQERVRQVYASGQRPLTVLTRCAAALATLPVLAEVHPQAKLIWFDAHADLNTPDQSDSGFLGGMVLSAAAGLWTSGLGAGFDPSQLIYVGVRDIDSAEQKLIEQHGIPVLPVSNDLAQKLKEAIGNAPVYLHLDCDVMQPGLIPTDYSVPGGLSFQQLTEIMTALSRNDVVGIEISEFQEAPEAARAAEKLVQAVQLLL